MKFQAGLHYNCMFVYKLQNNVGMSSTKLSKGDRKNWTPLKEVKSTPLSTESVRGQKVQPKTQSGEKGRSGKSNFLIP
ncbi:MAG: hypothetical protein ACK4E0_18730 [Chitinophagaceae bacterium]